MSRNVSPNSAQVKSAAQDRKSVAPGGARQGQTVVYTIQIAGDGATTTLSDPLPAGGTLAGGPTTSPASVPPAVNNGGTIAWSGTPPSGTVVTISYSATVDTATIGSIANTATIARGSAQKQLTAILIANPRQGFLPITRR